MRTIDVTNGGKEYVDAKVTERNGLALTAATFTIGLSVADTPPTTWQTPDRLVVDGATATVSILVGNHLAQIGVRRVWVKVGDTPEVVLLRAGTITVL